MGKLTIVVIYDNIKCGSGNYRELLTDQTNILTVGDKNYKEVFSKWCDNFIDVAFEEPDDEGESTCYHIVGIYQSKSGNLKDVLYYSDTSFEWEQAKEDINPCPSCGSYRVSEIIKETCLDCTCLKCGHKYEVE